MCFSASTGNGIFGTLALIVALALAGSAGMLCVEKIEYKQSTSAKIENQILKTVDYVLSTNVLKDSERWTNFVICYSGITFVAGVLQILAAIGVLEAAVKGKMTSIGSCCLGFLYFITILPVMAIIMLLVIQGITADNIESQGERFETWFGVMGLDVLYLVFGSLVIACMSRKDSQETEQC